VVVSVPTYGAIASLVAHTDMVATLLGRVAESLPGDFATHPLPLPPTEFLYAAGWHPRHNDDPGHRWLRDTLARAMAREDVPATGMSDAS
jgi:DNA-binding transcriptional LysR family regulator